MVKNNKYDTGYGVTMNMVHYILLQGLTGDVEKEYRENLKKQDNVAYNEYLAYEKLLNKK